MNKLKQWWKNIRLIYKLDMLDIEILGEITYEDYKKWYDVITIT